MQGGSNVSLDGASATTECAFCQRSSIAGHILKETATFRVVADHAPLVEGHLLIIPRDHYTCYGDVPAALDAELFALKQEVRRFFDRFYDTAVFWEHGIFRQTVFHAHLHCFPFGAIPYDLATSLHARTIKAQDDIRAWHATYGHYFYLENSRHALLFPPDMDRYRQVMQEVMWPCVSRHTQHAGWLSSQERQRHGKTLIEAVKDKWHTFQQEEAQHASSSSPPRTR